MGSPARYVTFTNAAVTYTPTSPPSLLIGSFATNGALHVHLTSSIFENGSQEIDSVPKGEYLISFDLQNPDTVVANSQPLYIVYDNGLGADVQSTAVNYVQTTYIPEPAGLSMIGMLTLLLSRKRT